MANTIIQIKRSQGSATPQQPLAAGELAYSAALNGSYEDTGTGKLYIGSPSSTTTGFISIGGSFYTSKIDGVTAGTAAASKLVLLDANSSVSGLGTVGATTFTGTVLTGSTSVTGGNLQLNGNTLSSTDTNGNVTINPNGTGTISIYGLFTLPRSAGTDKYVLTSDGAGGTSWAQPVSTLSFSNGSSTSTVNLLTQTFTLVGGTGITTSVSGQSVTIDIDTGEGGLVTTTGTQTLTNKTMDGGSNTFTNIGNNSLVNSSVTINGTSLSLGSTLTLTTTNISEGTNLYFTQARAQQSLTGTETAGDLGGGSYNSSTGAITFNKIANSSIIGLFSTATSGEGFGNLSYNSGTGVFTYSKVTATEVRGTLAAANNGSGYGALSYDSATGTYTFAVVTDANIRERFAATSTAGYGSLSYSTLTGTYTFTAVTDGDIRGRFAVNQVPAATGTTALDSLTYDSAGGTFTFTPVTDQQVHNLFSAGTSGTGFGDLQYNSDTGAITLTKVSAGDIRGTLGAATSGTGFGSLSYDSGTGTYTFNVVTAAQVQGTITAVNTDTSTFGTLSYNSSTGQISFAGVSTANIRGQILAGTGVSYDTSSGTVSIGQAVGTTNDVTFNKVTISTSTFASSDAVTKAYVDSFVTGLDVKASVKAATTANITLSGTQTIDGVALNVSDRVLVKNQTTATENGIWVVSSSAWSRSDDMSDGPEFPGAFTFVEEGTTYADTGWVCTTNAPVVVGTTPITWVQFSAAGAYTASKGVQLVGNDFSLASAAAGDGLAFDAGTGALSVNVNTATLQITGDTIDIKAQGVTNSMLANKSTTFNGGSGTVDVDLGAALTITGSAPMSTAIVGSTLTISIAAATTSTLGVASFSDANFSVNTGAVSIKAGGVDLTTNVTGTLAVSNGGTGLATITTNGVVIGAGANAVTTATGTQYQLLTVGAGGVPAFGAVSLDQAAAVTGTLAVANGGTGRASLTATQLLIGDGTNAVAQSGDLAFAASGTTGANELTVGTAKIATTGSDVIITATGTNGDIILAPNGTGIVSIGGPNSGSSSLGTSAGETLNISSGAALNLSAATTMTLTTTSSDIVMALANTSTYKVSISGPSASTYATGLEANDIPNVQYVLNAIATIDGGIY